MQKVKGHFIRNIQKVDYDNLNSEILWQKSYFKIHIKTFCHWYAKKQTKINRQNPPKTLFVVLANFYGIDTLTNGWFQTISSLPTNSQNSLKFSNWILEATVSQLQHIPTFNQYSWVISVADMAFSLSLASSSLVLVCCFSGKGKRNKFKFQIMFRNREQQTFSA